MKRMEAAWDFTSETLRFSVVRNFRPAMQTWDRQRKFRRTFTAALDTGVTNEHVAISYIPGIGASYYNISKNDICIFGDLSLLL